MSWQGWVAVIWVLFSPIGCLVWWLRERRRPEREDRLRVERLEELLEVLRTDRIAQTNGHPSKPVWGRMP
jgi:hypothetical protein